MHFEIKLISTFINPLISTFINPLVSTFINPYNKDHFKPAGHLLFINFDGFVGFFSIPVAIKSSLVAKMLDLPVKRYIFLSINQGVN